MKICRKIETTGKTEVIANNRHMRSNREKSNYWKAKCRDKGTITIGKSKRWQVSMRWKLNAYKGKFRISIKGLNILRKCFWKKYQKSQNCRPLSSPIPPIGHQAHTRTLLISKRNPQLRNHLSMQISSGKIGHNPVGNM